VTEAVIRRVEAAGCPVLAVTVDLPVSNREAIARHRRDGNPACVSCHAPDAGVIPPKPMFEGLVRSETDRSFLDWDYIDRIRDATSMRLMLKGIVTAEDAMLAIEHGVEGIIVSNHGGRAEDSGRSTIESLAEVVDAVDGRVPVIVDSGFRRGTDIFKALALGADAIAIGRPYLWGLGTFGQEGVETVLDILKREFEIVMRQAGTLRISDIDRSYIA
jgi:isopentenyl diphosphate isomerase/L-lactate dehydrogenase-like FMN-dependent dehydrogenase